MAMKEYVFDELGYFTESKCKKIKNIMDGKTYMNFEVVYSNFNGNCILIIKTDYDCSEKEIKGLFMNCLVNELI